LNAISSLVIYSPDQNEFDGVFKYAKNLSIQLSAPLIQSLEYSEGGYKQAISVHNFSNNISLPSMLRNFKAHPGIVILHDLHISFQESLNWANEDREYLQSFMSSSRYAFGQTNNIVPAIARLFPLILVHSDIAMKSLIQMGISPSRIEVIPHPCFQSDERHWIKNTQKNFNISTYGHFGPQKDYGKLFEIANVAAKVTELPVTLTFVGPRFRSSEKAMRSRAKSYPNINYTFVFNLSDDKFMDSMVNTDLAIQLRESWQGEASGVLSQLISLGVPTITNMNNYFEDEQLLVLDKSSGEIEIDKFLRILNSRPNGFYRDPSMAIESNFLHPEFWANKILKITSDFNSKISLNDGLLSSFKSVGNLCDQQITNSVWTQVFPLEGMRIFADISQLWREEQFSGIQRATVEFHKEILQLFASPSYENVILPTDLTPGISDYYTDAMSHDPLSEYFLGNAKEASHLLLLQPNYSLVENSSVLIDAVANGVRLISQIHDLLPITSSQYFHPDFRNNTFEPWLSLIVRISSALVVSSHVVKNDLENWAQENGYELPLVEVIPLASFIKPLNPSTSKRLLDKFVMVGTIEPRKGHEEVLDVFEIMWQEGSRSELHIIGKQGWQVEDLMQRIMRHPQLNKKLFMHGRLSDSEMLQHLSNSSATIFASFGEGFGLPIVEAAAVGTPLILRDLSVFREVTSSEALFFRDSSELLALIKGIELGQIKLTSPMPQKWNWQDAANALFHLIKQIP
jgi:glycosyltransferase involved in cell wall biosynthesis